MKAAKRVAQAPPAPAPDRDADSVVETMRDADGKRRDLALNATWQLEAIFASLRLFAAHLRTDREEVTGFDNEHLPDVMLALAIRGAVLTSAAMSAIGDPNKPTEEIEEMVTHGDC